VNHLDDRGERVMLRSVVATRLRCEQQQSRSQSLAAAGDDVFRNLSDEHYVGMQGIAQNTIDRTQLVAQDRLQLLICHGWVASPAVMGGEGSGPGVAPSRTAPRILPDALRAFRGCIPALTQNG
jgi:hypothetical protein